MALYSVVGDSFVDIVAGHLDKLPQWGQGLVCTNGIQIQAGGSALNTSTHLSNLVYSERREEGDVEHIKDGISAASVSLHTAFGMFNRVEFFK